MSVPVTAPAEVPPELAARLFRHLFPEYGLYTVGGVHVVVPKADPLSADAPVFAGATLGDVARQIGVHAAREDRAAGEGPP